MLIAGLDIGTTGCKVAVYESGGAYLGKVYASYPVMRAHSEHEVDGAAIAEAVLRVLKETAEKYPDLAGIGVTSFGESFVLLDENDVPLLPVMLYTDPRGEQECREIEAKVGREKMILSTGISPASMYGLPKMMWVKRNRPEIWAKVKRVCQMQDYIVYLLCGDAQIDYSLATRTMAFDIHSLTWNEEIFAAAGVDTALLSRPVAPGTKAGALKKEYADAWGLKHEVQLVSVSQDQVAAAVGSGVFDSTCAVDGAGTVECIAPVFSDYDPLKMAKGSYAVVPYAVPGKYVCYAFSFTGGALVDWYTRTLAGFAQKEADEKGVDVHKVLEQGYTGRPTGLLVLPHFAGAATPYMDTGSKGCILGLSIENTVQDLYQACMEGVVYEMHMNMDKLQEAGVEVKGLRATGGGARSRIWLQMKADILGVPVTALRSEEAGTAGSAMLVGVAMGAYKDLEEAAAALVVTSETFLPRPEAHAQYELVYARYRRLYDAVRPLV